MAVRQIKISDLDGSDGANITIVVRDYPGLDAAKAIDVTDEQADAVIAKAIKNAVTLEIRNEDTTTREVMVTKTEFDKWIGKPEDVLGAARGLKGRVPGTRMNGH